MSEHSLGSFGRAENSILYYSSLGGLQPSIMENLCSCGQREDWGEKKVLWFFGLFVSINRDKGVGVFYVHHHPGTCVPQEGGVC